MTEDYYGFKVFTTSPKYNLISPKTQRSLSKLSYKSKSNTQNQKNNNQASKRQLIHKRNKLYAQQYNCYKKQTNRARSKPHFLTTKPINYVKRCSPNIKIKTSNYNSLNNKKLTHDNKYYQIRKRIQAIAYVNYEITSKSKKFPLKPQINLTSKNQQHIELQNQSKLKIKFTNKHLFIQNNKVSTPNSNFKHRNQLHKNDWNQYNSEIDRSNEQDILITRHRLLQQNNQFQKNNQSSYDNSPKNAQIQGKINREIYSAIDVLKSSQSNHNTLNLQSRVIKKTNNNHRHHFNNIQNKQTNLINQCLQILPKINQSILFNNKFNIFIKQLQQYQNQLIKKQINTNDLILNQILKRISYHCSVINSLIQFVQMTEDIYTMNDDSEWSMLQSFMLFKKYYNERTQIVSTLKGYSKKSCFRLRNIQIINQQIKPYLQCQQILQRLEYIERINKIIYKYLENYKQKILSKKQSFEKYQTKIISEQLDRKIDVKLIMIQLDMELQALFKKIKQIGDGQQDQEDTINIRCYKIMEIIFLLSELQNVYVKEYYSADQIEKFQQYYQKNYSMYKQTIKFFCYQ